MEDKSWAKNLFAFLILLASLTVLFHALPQLKASLNHVPVRIGIDKLDGKKKLTDAQLSRLINIAQASIAGDEQPRYWEDLGALYFYKAQNQGFSEASGLNLLKEAKSSMERALSLSPANTYLWYRLAVVGLLLKEPKEQTANYLLMSIKTGPNEAEFIMQRLSLCLTVFPAFTAEGRDILRSQIIKAWAFSQPLFLKNYAGQELQMETISVLLNEKYPSVLKEIKEKLEKLHQ